MWELQPQPPVVPHHGVRQLMAVRRLEVSQPFPMSPPLLSYLHGVNLP